MEHFFIITNKPKDEQLTVTKEIEAYLCAHGKSCTVCVKERQDGLFASAIPKDTDCILVLGGDGTLLQAAVDTLDLDVPLVGINLGNLGYMAEVEKGNVKDALDNLMQNQCEVEERMMLDGNILYEGGLSDEIHALNDIVLTRSGSLKIITYEIYVNGQFLNRYHADGLIVSTPTGSTGYNMSAGGPIVEPSAKMLLLTPICPHTLSARSIVLSSEDVIEVAIGSGRNGEEQEIEVNFDGSFTRHLKTGDRVKICQSDRVTKFVRLSKVSFLEVLHRKMSE